MKAARTANIFKSESGAQRGGMLYAYTFGSIICCCQAVGKAHEAAHHPLKERSVKLRWHLKSADCACLAFTFFPRI